MADNNDNLVQLTIDGRQVEVARGTSVIEAARALGIEIPAYCYHPKMKAVGACRVCAVEIEGQRKPINMACVTEAVPNMVVHTRSDAASAAREGIIEYLLINHPLDCPVCDRGGECDLQDFTLRYGPQNTRFIEQKRHFPKSVQVGERIILDRERCIMCQRCVRFCSEIAIEEGLVLIERGNRSHIGTFDGKPYDSQFSGNTVELCPVGALTAKPYRFKSRPWEQQHYSGICTGCALGCNITIDVRFDEVVRFRSRTNDQIDDGWLCDKGRYGLGHIHSEHRIASPLLRTSDGKLEPVSWEKALEAAAAGLTKVKGEQAGVLLGSGLSLEDGQVFLRLARSLLRTGNITHEFAHELAVGAAAEDIASGQVMGCDDAEVIVCLGSHPLETHPVLDLRIKKGLRRAAKLVALNEQPVLDGVADFYAQGKPGELWAKLLKAIDALPEEGPRGLKIPEPRPWEAGGSTSRDWDKLAAQFRGKERVLIIVSGDLSAQGLEGVAKDVKARGWATAPQGLLHLRGASNALGLDLIGCRPEVGPAGEPLGEKGAYGDKWGDFSAQAGKGYGELTKASLKAMVAVGCDPMSREGAKKPEFLVACATLPNATSEKADVVFPLSTWTEANGVFIASDGTIQFSRQAILPVHESQPAWAIASALIKAISGKEAPYKTTRQVFAEIGSLNPALLGYSYDNFEAKSESHWSYPQQADHGMPRPDLSAIPVPAPDTPMWMPVAYHGSKVERVARQAHGDTPPPATGQDDPREIAARLGLAQGYVRHPQREVQEATTPKVWFVPLRLGITSAAQPPGPTPAKRHHRLGIGPAVVEGLPAMVMPSALPPSQELDESVAPAPEPAGAAKVEKAAEAGQLEKTAEEASEEAKDIKTDKSIKKASKGSKRKGAKGKD